MEGPFSEKLSVILILVFPQQYYPHIPVFINCTNLTPS